MLLKHRRGRFGFALGIIFFLGLNSCSAQESAAKAAGPDLYEGLKKRHDATGTAAEAITHLEKALNDSNPSIAAAAAAELIHFAGDGLSAKTMLRIRQRLCDPAGGKAADSWVRAFEAIEQKDVFSLLLSGESHLLDEAALYALREWRRFYQTGDDGSFAAENAAIDGRIAVSRFRYGEALLFFRIALDASPEIFFRYPDLISDLGRCFQYTAATGTEGVELLVNWEKSGEFIPSESENLVRFRLLFFAARIARQRNAPHIELFERALPFAVEISPEQVDACIWYILDSSLSMGAAKTIQYVQDYISRWHNNDYFFDVMDKLSRELVLRRQWESVLRVFALLREHSNTLAAAQFAWITGRAIEDGFFSPGQIRRAYEVLSGAAAPANADAQALAKEYMRIACGNAFGAANAVYYHARSCAALDEPFLVLQTEPPAAADRESYAMQFLLGFFEHDAARFAPRYIRAMESGLSFEDLRRLAEALGKAEQYQESMRLVSLYAGKADYQPTQKDMELWYPRPFEDLVERYAQETGIEPALLYALIRTESAFNSGAVSRAGAIGLTQLMPATADEMAARIRRRGGPDYEALSDPAANIHIGATYFAYLNDRMGDTLLALLAYNGGMNRVRRWRGIADNYAGAGPRNLPPDLFLETVEYPETRNYGRSVLAAASMYRELYYK